MDRFQNNLCWVREFRYRSAWMSDSSSMKLKNRKNKSVMMEIWIACDRGWESEKGAQRNWCQGISVTDRQGVCIFQNSFNCTLKVYAFHCVHIIPNKVCIEENTERLRKYPRLSIYPSIVYSSISHPMHLSCLDPSIHPSIHPFIYSTHYLSIFFNHWEPHQKALNTDCFYYYYTFKYFGG